MERAIGEERGTMSRRASIWRACLAGACLLVAACGGVEARNDGAESCELSMPEPDEEMYERLEDYCFFGGEPASQHEQTSQGVVPYGVRSKLYSDKSDKFRFVVLPDGEKIVFDETEMWEFPEGTVIVKTFYFPDDARQPAQGRRLLETRLLRKRGGAWEPAVYLWNDAQTEAKRHQIGQNVTVDWIDEGGESVTTNYRVPDENKCKSCHGKENEVTLLGPRTRQLNRTYRYAEGRKNQIAHFADRGMFEGEVPAPEELSRLPDPKNEELSTEERARAYLEGNCAHCHRPGGGASNSALFVNWRQEDRRSLGICKEPPAAGGGTGGYEYSIKPGHPDESIMVYRMKSSEPDIKMPELPLRTVDEFGVRIVSEWIAQMEPKGCDRDGGG
jgi:uncharacterized repeat protein (TIGR03806 family)